ncbi:MAG: hypothetical protein WC091_12240 [Sulfuricellaceae bacterium]
MKPITNITFNFNEAEDRIVLHCTFDDQAPVALLLTRRMTGAILEKLAIILMESSDMAAALPAKLREDVIMMEHAQTLAKMAEQAAHTDAVAPPTAPPTAQKPLVRHLLTRIDIRRQPEHCALLLYCNSSETALAVIMLTRAQLHWFVNAMDRFAQRAEWELKPLQRGWLAQRDEAATVFSGTAVLH